MTPPRDFALIQTPEQWELAAHQNTSLDLDTGSVSLSVEPPATPADSTPAEVPAVGGLAFDAHCRLYRSLPSQGRVERILWTSGDESTDSGSAVSRFDLFERGSAETLGGADVTPLEWSQPCGLAVDAEGRLFVAERGASRVRVFDLLEQRVVRAVVTIGLSEVQPAPLDVAVWQRGAMVLLNGPPYLVTMTARTTPRPIALRDLAPPLGRIAVSTDGQIAGLANPGTPDARVVPLDGSGRSWSLPFATDLEFAGGDRQSDASPALHLVVARRPNDDFVRLTLRADREPEFSTLAARGYDGGGIVRAPDGRIGFWTTGGFRYATPARVRYKPLGRVTTFRLDSGEYQSTWGRIFLDACIPSGTDLRVHYATADEPSEVDPYPRTPPDNLGVRDGSAGRPRLAGELLPPMPPTTLVPAEGEVDGRLYRRANGRELPWLPRASAESLETYEAPVRAAPGRYLWVTLELRGDTRRTPRFRGLRVERQAHDLHRLLPRAFSRDARAEDFLRRYLSLFDAVLSDLDGAASARHALVDPRSTPEELLPWLAGFVGLVLDDRWSPAKKRRLIREAVPLFRFRGTLPGLRRFLGIYLDREPVLIEHYRVRGFGGAVVGGDASLASQAIVGGGFRLGGAVGVEAVVSVSDTPARPHDAFRTHAHRFSVLVPASLDSEQLDVVRHILDTHRPAHTVFDVCTADAGMRVGMGFHIGLSTVVGPSSGFSHLRAGRSLLGREGVLGWSAATRRTAAVAGSTAGSEDRP